jgi:hypothetical protein
MDDTHYLKNLEVTYSGTSKMKSSNTMLYNSPFMPGHTMAYNGKKSIPVANPLGSAALAMTNNHMNSLSLSLTASDPVKDEAARIINKGPKGSEVTMIAPMPMAIDPRASPEPSLLYPNPVYKPTRNNYPPVSLNQPVMGSFGAMPPAPISMPVAGPLMGPLSGATPLMGPLTGPMPGGLPMAMPSLVSMMGGDKPYETK